MLTPTLSLFFIATTLAVVAYAPRGVDAIEPKICGTPYGALRARSCDDRDDGWTRLAKEYVRYEDCATKGCPSLENGNVTKVLEFLTTGDHCEQNSLNTPNEISTLDAYSSTLGECNRVNGCGAACPCNVDEPCRCSDTQKKLDTLLDASLTACLNETVLDAYMQQYQTQSIDTGLFPSLYIHATTRCGTVFRTRGRRNDRISKATPTSQGVGDAVNEHTISPVASLGKMIGSTLILKMVDRGLINLNEPARTFIPEYENTRVIEPLSPAMRQIGPVVFVRNQTTFTVRTSHRHNMTVGSWFAIPQTTPLLLGGYPSAFFNAPTQVVEVPTPFSFVALMPPNIVYAISPLLPELIRNSITAVISGTALAPLRAAYNETVISHDDIGYISYNDYANGGPRTGSALLLNNSNTLSVYVPQGHGFVVGDTIGFQAPATFWYLAGVPIDRLQFVTQLTPGNVVNATHLSLTFAGLPSNITFPPFSASGINAACVLLKLEAGAQMSIAGGLPGTLLGTPMYYLTKSPDNDVTLRHIMTMTSGHWYGSAFVSLTLTPLQRTAALIQSGIANTLGVGSLPSPAITTLEQWTRARASLPLIYNPGAAWAYTGDISQLGYVAEVVDRRPGGLNRNFSTMFQQEVAVPLGMNSTGFKTWWTNGAPPENFHVVYSTMDRVVFANDSLWSLIPALNPPIATPIPYLRPTVRTAIPFLESKTGQIVLGGAYNALATAVYDQNVVLPERFDINLYSTPHDTLAITAVWKNRGRTDLGERFISEATIQLATSSHTAFLPVGASQNSFNMPPARIQNWGLGVAISHNTQYVPITSKRAVSWGSLYRASWLADLDNKMNMVGGSTTVNIPLPEELANIEVVNIVYVSLDGTSGADEPPFPISYTQGDRGFAARRSLQYQQ
jgi:CubicO group peptidase (beta-lactamase class C family)